MVELITGHRGFIGSKLYEKIEAVGIDVREGKNVISCELPPADIVYHLASQSSVEASWLDPVHDMDNIRMTARIVKEYTNSRIIFVSSAAAIDPQSPYGFSKNASAEYIKRFHTNYVICVLPNVYGEGSKSVVDIFKKSNSVVVYGDGQQKRDYVHVDDIVDGLIKAKDWPTGEYFLGSGIATTVLQLAGNKNIQFEKAHKEARDSLLTNTTPNWYPTISVMDYLYE